MTPGAPQSFGARLKALREAAGFTQEELATIAGLSVHAVSALERGERRRPHLETVRALSAALDLTPVMRDAFVVSARPPAQDAAVDELSAATLPLPLTTLLGRERDVELLQKWLADPVVRLITLVGPGGVGKTRLALELAHALATAGAIRVALASLAVVHDASFVATAIAEALGLEGATERDLSGRARAACRDSPTLLVLDNFEHLLAAAPIVADLLTSVAALRLLVTSRAPLQIRGERQYAVGPLALEPDSETTSPADLARSPAVQLFVERVRDVEPDFCLTSANGPAVAAICRRLDALPLGLEVAAPWIKVLTVDDLLRRLERDVLLSAVGPRDLPARQQTMNATVAWSCQLLDPDERRAFRRFGALPGRFPIEAAAAVLGVGQGSPAASDEALAAAVGLIDKSLLQRAETSTASRPLFRMLETVRAYAALELAAAGERDEALEGLVLYCTSEASLVAEGLVGPAQVAWLDRVRDDLDNYRGALAWLVERGRPAEAVHIAWGLFWFWVIRGHASEGLRWYEQTLKLPSLPPAVESRALIGAAAMRYTQGQLERARTELTRALALARGAGDTDVVVHAEFVFGHVEHAAGNLAAARERFSRSAEGFKAARKAWGTGHLLTALAWVTLATGDAAEVERLLDEAAPSLQNAGPWFRELGLYIRAILAVRRGNADQALALVRESLVRIREFQDKFAFVYALVPLAAAARLTGDHAWVARITGARDAVTDRTGAMVVDPQTNDLCEQTEREARARLGPDRWAQAYGIGRRSSIEALLNDIDGALGATP